LISSAEFQKPHVPIDQLMFDAFLLAACTAERAHRQDGGDGEEPCQVLFNEVAHRSKFPSLTKAVSKFCGSEGVV